MNFIRMNPIGKACLVFSIILLLPCCRNKLKKMKKNKIFQNSTINALAEGLYEGDISFGELKKHGDTGLGTFQHLDGEMIGLDGVFYQVNSKGKVLEVADDMLTPFSIVCFLDKTNKIEYQVPQGLNFSEVEEFIKKEMETGVEMSANYIYYFRIDGVFSRLKLRSVPKQKNGTRLVEVIPHQTVFNYNDLKGTMVGFFFPDYMRGLNVAGFHFHFISDDRKKGGHVLDFVIQEGNMVVNEKSDFDLQLPKIPGFGNMDLTQTNESELDTIER